MVFWSHDGVVIEVRVAVQAAADAVCQTGKDQPARDKGD
jgi:hypothetical protein